VRPLEDIERDVIRFAIAHYDEQCRKWRGAENRRSTLYRKLEASFGNTDANANETAHVVIVKI